MRFAWVTLCLALVACGGPAARSPTPIPSVTTETSIDPDRELFIGHLEGAIRSSYAPLEHKRQNEGWSLEAQLRTLRAAARGSETDAAQFRRALYRFVRSLDDIHSSIQFDASDAVWLGLHLMRTKEGYRVAWVDRSIHPDEPRLGDEVVSIDGRPIAEVVREAGAQTAWRSTPAFAQAFAEWFTTLRAEGEWDRIPAPGTAVTLTLGRGDETRELQLSWRDVDDEDGEPVVTRCPFWGRSQQSYVRELGSVVWRPTDVAHVPSFVFEHDGQRHGYLRLWTYSWSPADAQRALAELDAAVDAFNEQGVRSVVIDQTGNGGGNFTLGLTMLSRVSQVERVGPTQRFRYAAGGGLVGFGGRDVFRQTGAALAAARTEAEVEALFDEHPLLSSALGFLPPTVQTATELSGFLSFVADPPPAEGPLSPPHYQIVERYRPEPSRGAVFTGPVLLLVDERNISAAEYVAAALRDNGGVTLFGRTTSGAGGDQRTFTRDRVCGGSEPLGPLDACLPGEVAAAMQRLGVRSYSLTVTLGLRQLPNGDTKGPIENVGVAPHVPYAITAADLSSNMAPMREAILAALPAPR